jgi:hypothetical protein
MRFKIFNQKQNEERTSPPADNITIQNAPKSKKEEPNTKTITQEEMDQDTLRKLKSIEKAFR